MKYKLTEDHLDLKEGAILHEFFGQTYGLLREDEEFLGESCIAVSREEGKGPFRIVPLRKLEEQ